MNNQVSNTVQIFNSPQFGELRTINGNNKPLFIATDVAKALGYIRPADAITSHCKGVSILPTPTTGGVQNVKYIPESDVFRLIMRSKLPQAEQFQDWVCEEVLPSIRNNGGYIVASEEETPEEIMAKALIVAQKTIQATKDKARRLESQNQIQADQLKEQESDVKHCKDVLNAEGALLVTQVASEFGMSAQKLNKKLKDMGVQYKVRDQWILLAKYKDKGYTKTETTTIERSGKNPKTRIQTLWTEKGRKFLHELLKAKQETVVYELELTQ